MLRRLSYRVGFSVRPNLEELFIAEEAGGQHINCVAKERGGFCNKWRITYRIAIVSEGTSWFAASWKPVLVNWMKSLRFLGPE